MTISTHLLDAVAGRPAAGVAVTLSRLSPATPGGPGGSGASRPDGDWRPVESGSTGADGRHRFEAATAQGVYRLTFDTGAYFAARGIATFYPEVTIAFTVAGDDAGHYHVPLLLSPFAYSTYRGS